MSFDNAYKILPWVSIIEKGEKFTRCHCPAHPLNGDARCCVVRIDSVKFDGKNFIQVDCWNQPIFGDGEPIPCRARANSGYLCYHAIAAVVAHFNHIGYVSYWYTHSKINDARKVCNENVDTKMFPVIMKGDAPGTGMLITITPKVKPAIIKPKIVDAPIEVEHDFSGIDARLKEIAQNSKPKIIDTSSDRLLPAPITLKSSASKKSRTTRKKSKK